MKYIGLTGGIGCGKTTVLNVFESLGVPCFIADRHAATYYNEPDFVNKLCGIMGDGILKSDGSVDKQAIARIVFNDRSKLLQLNGMVHPRVMNDFRRWADSQPTTVPYVILESAIIYEYDLNKALDGVIAVYLEKEERIRRLQLRDSVSREAIEARMRNQLSAEAKLDLADWVILNYEGNPRQRQVETIHNRIINSL